MKMKRMTEKLSWAMVFAVVMAFAVSAWAAEESPMLVSETPTLYSSAVVEESLSAEEISLTFSEPIDPASVSDAFHLKVVIPGIGYGMVTGDVALDDSGTTLTFLPDSDLNADLDYIVVIEGAKDMAGNPLETYEQSFDVDDGDDDSDDGDDGLPVIAPDAFIPFYYTTMTWDRLNNITDGTEEGLGIDLGDPTLRGNISVSQYPFEAGDSDYDYAYYIDQFGEISEGAGILPLAPFYTPKYDANEWLTGGLSSATPTAEYRLDLFQGEDYYGTFISHVSFEMTDGVFRKLPTILDGPYVTMVSSDDPTSAEIVWETDEPCYGEVITDSATYNGVETKNHAVKLTGLSPETEYEYTVRCEASDGRETFSNTYTMRTAPAKGQGTIRFAFASDSRPSSVGDGPPIGDRNRMGTNAHIFSKLVAGAYVNDADFFVFGGDLVWGMTTEPEDFTLELKGWKQVMAPFWRSRPVYAGMGNHEVAWNLTENFEWLDKWPYETDSGEAIFAAEFYNPSNGPEPSDPRRPTYQENVYSFQYGPVMVVSVNNTYWLGVPSTGGSPWGYIMQDQLEWVENTIAQADSDSTVKTIFVFTHSPIFPSMRHAGSAMFQAGNNNVRAYTKNAETGELEPEAMGIIESRNRLWKALAGSPKVAAVFTGDEHAYHRTLISSSTPVGIYPDDDTDGDGVLDKFSPNPEFTHPIWHITCGGGGAPYVANVESEVVPWTAERVTSHYGYLIIQAEDDKASLKLFSNAVGEVMDQVDDLMAIKQ